MSRKLDVYLDWGAPVCIGQLWIHRQKGRETASFQYTHDWLNSGFELEPALPLKSGVFHVEKGLSLFKCFSDSAPDRWGRVLLMRRENMLARQEKRSPVTLMESDFLLGVNDRIRHGAFRFKESGSDVFLTDSGKNSIPPLIHLRALMNSSMRLIQHTENEEDLKLLLAPGSSLGGSRPKASVIDENGRLMMAKFPNPHDEWDIPLWEYIAYRLAEKAGLRIPRTRLEKMGSSHVLLLERFDRFKNSRIPFASAMTLLEAKDGENRSYLELAEILQRDGSHPSEDLLQLWKRMVFNILIANVDDHLRNHGFLRDENGWRLSPVYDLEATPATHKARILQTYITETDGTADPELALSVASYFGLSLPDAKKEIADMQKVVSKWDKLARRLGAAKYEIEIMYSAFCLPA